MISGLIGKKLGMAQIFDKEGNVVPITVVEAGPCAILEVKDNPKKVRLGFGEVKESRLSKATLGFYKKLGVTPRRVTKEFQSTDNNEYKVGQELKADFFKAGDFVDVTGISIGKGFQGGMKLHHWAGGKATHGSMHHRRVGSISSSADPSRVYKGRTMPGHMGTDQVTVQGLRVMGLDVEKNLLLLKGAVPGHERGTIFIVRSKKRAFKALDEQKVTVAKKVNPMKQSKKAVGASPKPAKGGK
jgi:large subunit ribosomal protein L3